MSHATQTLPQSLARVWCEHLRNSALLPTTQTGEDNRAWTLCFTRRRAASPGCTPAGLNNRTRGHSSVQARLLQSTLRTQCRHDRIGPLPPRSPLLPHRHKPSRRSIASAKQQLSRVCSFYRLAFRLSMSIRHFNGGCTRATLELSRRASSAKASCQRC